VNTTRKKEKSGFAITRKAIVTDALQSIGTIAKSIQRGVIGLVETGNRTETAATAGRKRDGRRINDRHNRRTKIQPYNCDKKIL
jgi:hypothetical protein